MKNKFYRHGFLLLALVFGILGSSMIYQTYQQSKQEDPVVSLFEAIQDYVWQITLRTQANQNLLTQKEELFQRLDGEVELFELNQVRHWENDDLTKTIKELLQAKNKLLVVGDQMAWVADYAEFKEVYANQLDPLTLEFLTIQETWDYTVLIPPKLEDLLKHLESIYLLKPQWEGTLLGSRWQTIETDFNRFVFYLLEEEVQQKGSFSDLSWRLVCQFKDQYPDSLLGQTVSHYLTLQSDELSHVEIIKILIEHELK